MAAISAAVLLAIVLFARLAETRHTDFPAKGSTASAESRNVVVVGEKHEYLIQPVRRHHYLGALSANASERYFIRRVNVWPFLQQGPPAFRTVVRTSP